MKDKNKKPFLFALIYGTLLAGFTGYVMLDTFVIPKAENTDAGGMNYSVFENIETRPLSPSSDGNNAAGRSETSESGEAVSSSQEDDSSSGARRGKHSDHGSKTRDQQNGTPGQSGKDSSSSQSSEGTYAVSGTQNSSSYSDENISITLTEYYENNTAIYVADIRLSSAQYLKTAFADDTYGKNVTAPTSGTAAENNAILAVNGDYYGARERGIVIRNGVLYRETASADTDVLCIYADGHFEITDSGEKTAQQMIDDGVWQAFSFGPGLIEDGEITVTAGDEVGRAMASNPRTAIGMIDGLHYVFVVSDGRTSASEGLSLSELAAFMKSLGVQTAYNLDGGGSSTLYYQGEVINNPTTTGKSTKERSVSDIVYIGY